MAFPVDHGDEWFEWHMQQVIACPMVGNEPDPEGNLESSVYTAAAREMHGPYIP